MPRVKQIIYPDYKPKFGWRGWALVVFGDAPVFDIPGTHYPYNYVEATSGERYNGNTT